MEFYPEVKQEPESPLVIDEAGHQQCQWDDDEEHHYSPQLMDLSTRKHPHQQVNNNYFFAEERFYDDYPAPPHPEFYHQTDFDEAMEMTDDVADPNDEEFSVDGKGLKQRVRKKAASSVVRAAPAAETETSRAVANHRERQRTKYLNTVLEKLRHIVPSLPSDKLSKKQILMLAAQYIEFLSQVVQCNQSFRGPISRPSSPYKIREELGYCFRVWRMQTEYHTVDCPQ